MRYFWDFKKILVRVYKFYKYRKHTLTLLGANSRASKSDAI